MANITIPGNDEFGDYLLIDGIEVGPNPFGPFEVLASRLQTATLSDLPVGISVVLCDRVIGSKKDVYRRSPSCIFEHSGEGRLLARCETAFFLENELEESALKQFLEDALSQAKAAIEPLVEAGQILDVRESINDESAFLKYSLLLPDQLFPEAEAYVAAFERRIHEGFNRPLLFLCHASEDKPFAERLVSELDRRALHAWFDKREVLVGDSIVGKINEALSQCCYVVALLSSHSVKKPWVARELNSSLMRQLADEGIQILPVLLEDCQIPPLLADIKYADFRNSFDRGLSDLLAAIRGREN
jgi:TIR domain